MKYKDKPQRRETPRFIRDKAEKLINGLFEYFGNPSYIRETQYKPYFKEYERLSEEDI